MGQIRKFPKSGEVGLNRYGRREDGVGDGLHGTETGGKQANGKAQSASWEARRGVLRGLRYVGQGAGAVGRLGEGLGGWVGWGGQDREGGGGRGTRF